MPCLFVFGALFVPRLVVIYLAFMTNWFWTVFDSWLWPILGFVFAPTTLLWYTVVENMYDGNWGTFQIIVMVVAIVIDLSPSTGRRRRRD